MKITRVITVRVPVDLHAVAESGCSAFASATPLRLYHLLSLAVREAIGARAPQEHFMRNLRATVAGLRAGRFTVDVNGRTFAHPDEVVVCGGDTVRVRFFLARERLKHRRQTALAREH
ncbi:MAG TPA: hypothetical protein VFW34_11960 [Candidatus Rubrimentiphilum sp.]|nr:hypothetical protein [Candidatus Rubrimentiphilum sp.]